ncbi:hypothetical protein Fmac_025041 [Flemingia macrophylla]|uniref:Uncharacterized protein n=1 Tax=Flemingia macrophylla TaxID=520843 RepID=A0ABD1LRP6_9FABA
MAEAPPITSPLFIIIGDNHPRLSKFSISNVDWFLPCSRYREHHLSLTRIIKETQSSKLLLRRYSLGPHELHHSQFRCVSYETPKAHQWYAWVISASD